MAKNGRMQPELMQRVGTIFDIAKEQMQPERYAQIAGFHPKGGMYQAIDSVLANAGANEDLAVLFNQVGAALDTVTKRDQEHGFLFTPAEIYAISATLSERKQEVATSRIDIAKNAVKTAGRLGAVAAVAAIPGHSPDQVEPQQAALPIEPEPIEQAVIVPDSLTFELSPNAVPVRRYLEEDMSLVGELTSHIKEDTHIFKGALKQLYQMTYTHFRSDQPDVNSIIGQHYEPLKRRLSAVGVTMEAELPQAIAALLHLRVDLDDDLFGSAGANSQQTDAIYEAFGEYAKASGANRMQAASVLEEKILDLASGNPSDKARRVLDIYRGIWSNDKEALIPVAPELTAADVQGQFEAFMAQHADNLQAGNRLHIAMRDGDWAEQFAEFAPQNLNDVQIDVLDANGNVEKTYYWDGETLDLQAQRLQVSAEALDSSWQQSVTRSGNSLAR